MQVSAPVNAFQTRKREQARLDGASQAALNVMARVWPFLIKVLMWAGFCACERVFRQEREQARLETGDISGLERDGPGLAIAIKVLMCRFLRLRTRFKQQSAAAM